MTDWRIVTGGLFAAGSTAYFLWGYLDALEAARNTPEKEVFDWIKCLKTVIPGVLGGFVAGYTAPQEGLGGWLMSLSGGFGFAHALRKGERLTLQNFYRR